MENIACNLGLGRKCGIPTYSYNIVMYTLCNLLLMNSNDPGWLQLAATSQYKNLLQTQNKTQLKKYNTTLLNTIQFNSISTDFYNDYNLLWLPQLLTVQ